MAKKIIEIKNVSKSFSGKDVLKDINLYINQGEFLTLLGPSGCGKTSSSATPCSRTWMFTTISPSASS